MLKTKKQLNNLKDEYISLTNRLRQLDEDELNYVIGGNSDIDIRKDLYENIILCGINSHGDNKKPTYPLWDENSNHDLK